jgi:chromosome segregation ATPase
VRARRDAAAKAEAVKKKEAEAAAAAAEALRLQKSRCDKLMKKIAEMGPVRALGLSLLSTDDEIRVAYQELSLEVHPDKNKALNAKVAFQALADAVDKAKLEIERARMDAQANSRRLHEAEDARREAEANARRLQEEAAEAERLRLYGMGNGFGFLHSANSGYGGGPYGVVAFQGRCMGITLKGTQCTRNAQPGRQYCYQHPR